MMETKYYSPIVRTLFFAVLGLLAFMTSCKKNNVGPDMLRAEMSDFSVNNQKAYIDGELYNCFEIGEKVRVNNSTGNVAALGRNDRQCDISGVPSATNSNYYAFYPVDLLANKSVDLSSGVDRKGVLLPRVQEYKYVNGHQSIQNPMAAELLNADENNYTLHFHNLCALLKVNIHTMSAFDSIKIQIKYNQNIYLSGAGTIDFNNHKIVMNTSGSNLYTDVTLALPQGHTGKPGGESFYIVVPAFKIANNAHPNDLILEIKNGSKTVKRYVKSLQKDNEILANHIYTLGTFMFDRGLFSVADGKTVIFAPGNLQWSYTNGGTDPTNHNTSPSRYYQKGTWRFAEHQYDFLDSASRVNALGNSSGEYTATSYTGWIDLFAWGGSGYDNTRPYYYNANDINGNHYCNNSSLGNYDWGTYNTIYNPKTGENDPAGTWYTLTKDEWDYLINSRGGSNNWWRYSDIYFTRDGKTIYGLLIYPDTTLEKPLGVSADLKPNNTSGYNVGRQEISSSDFNALLSYGCAFLPDAGRMDHSAGGMNVHISGEPGYYWANHSNGSDATYFKTNVGGASPITVTGYPKYYFLSVRLAHVVKDVSANISH